MTEFSAALLEFFGYTPASPNLGYNMRGWDCDYLQTYTCHYDAIGYGIIGLPVVIFTIYYFILDSPRFNRWWHWTICMAICAVALFAFAYTKAYNIMNAGDFTCPEFTFNGTDAIYMAMFAGLWSAVAYAVLSGLYRLLGLVFPRSQSKSINTKNTPWKQ